MSTTLRGEHCAHATGALGLSGLTMTRVDRQSLQTAHSRPKELIARHQFGALHGALENIKLVRELQVLRLEAQLAQS